MTRSKWKFVLLTTEQSDLLDYYACDFDTDSSFVMISMFLKNEIGANPKTYPYFVLDLPRNMCIFSKVPVRQCDAYNDSFLLN